MKKFRTFFVIVLVIGSLNIKIDAQIINVPLVIQEQTNWCWAASSACVLDYYGFTNAQCTIADYTRTVATWHNFGSVNCCTDPSQGCNYWNYMFGDPGSVQDILIHFGNLNTNIIFSYLSIPQIQTEEAAGRPFIFRWGWYSGGGHFLVGQGISGNNMYYMNPLPGYGYEISDYNWVVDDGVHSWTHTLTLCIPSVPGTISGNNSVCQGSSQTYSISPVSGATSYSWTLPSGWSGSSTTTSIVATVGSSGGTISVAAINACGTTIPQTLAVSVSPTPSEPGVISGNTTVCQGSSQTYSISAVSGATSYTWTLPTSWTGSSNTTSIVATVGGSSGTISVTANNACGSSSPRTLAVSVNPTPAQPGSISGNTTVCTGSSQTYSISPVPGATDYTWTLPSDWTGSSTTNSIFAGIGSLSGTISVIANNSCGSSVPQFLAVTVNLVPQQPGMISGNTTVCHGSTQIYSISAVPEASYYSWGLPADWSGSSSTTTISATVGSVSGFISVNASNDCGISANQQLQVDVSLVDTLVTFMPWTLIADASPATYQWVICPSMQSINGETGKTFSPSNDGSYAVIIDQNNCIDTSGCHTVILESLTTLNNGAIIMIYPNPAHDLITLKCSGIPNDNYTIIITDALGQKVIERMVKTTNKNLLADFNLGELSTGVYILIISSSEIRQAFRLVKQ